MCVICSPERQLDQGKMLQCLMKPFFLLTFAVLLGLLSTDDLSAEWQYTIVTSPLSLDSAARRRSLLPEKLARLLLDGVIRAIGFRRKIAVTDQTGEELHKLAKDTFATYERP
jgi:hypothetical protein